MFKLITWKRKTLRSVLVLTVIFLAALQAWANCTNLSSEDSVSYLDIADAYLRQEWNVAINSYWSPLYSWLLAIVMSILKPLPAWEFPAVKLVNFFTFLLALASFDFFLNQLLHYYSIKMSQDSPRTLFLRVPDGLWIVLGYALFCLSSIRWIRLSTDSPDMLVSALVYLASGILLRIFLTSGNLIDFIRLGVILGLGYLSKAALFPLAFVYLATAAFAVVEIRRAIPRITVALLAFVMVSAPWITVLSMHQGSLTFSTTGKINYVWQVNPGKRSSISVPDHHWQGQPAAYGTPKHSTRKIFDHPDIFEFGTPVGGTYPPWYDPSYWYKGLKRKFDLVKQIKVVFTNLAVYNEQFLGSLILSYLLLVCIRGSFRASLKDLITNWIVLTPAIAGLALYLLGADMSSGVVKTRLIAPFIVLLFAGVFCSVKLPNSKESKRLITGLTLIALLTIFSQLAFQSSKDFVTILREQEPIHWQLAKSLQQIGIQPGSKVANLGIKNYPWARLARVKIVAEIPDVKSFWAVDVAQRTRAIEAIEATGAKAIVLNPEFDIPKSESATGWQNLCDAKSCYVYPLNR